MQLSKIFFAALPALALASKSEDKTYTTTCTASTTLTKTMTLSKVHSSSHNATTPASTPTSSPTSSMFTTAPVVSTTGSGPAPTETDDTGAGVALDASRVALAGAVGMIVVALM